ncbi:MAG: efflux RND transporter periplasmic adaptor subunit [Acidiferrobacterales bacterium]
MTKMQLVLGACSVGILCGAPWPATAATVSALVRVEPLARHRVSATLTAYGAVSAETASRVTISLPRAGQVTRLALTDGAVVRRGETLFRFRTGASASASYEQAVAAVKFARMQVRHTQSLFAEKLATASQLAAVRRALADSEAALVAQRRMGNGLHAESVTAPFDGVVLNVAVAQGDRIGAGTPVLTLARSGRLRVRLGIGPEDVSRVAIGMPVSIRPVFDGGIRLHARVAAVHGAINPQTGLVDVVVNLDGPQTGRLLPGMEVRGRITLETVKNWAVPRAAVLRNAKGAYLFQIDHGRARRVYVATGLENDSLVEVKGPFDPSLPVVVLGNYELKNGMAVRESRQ